MADIELLKKHIDDSGMTMTAISEKSGINRVTLYNRLNGVGEFTVPEVIGLAAALHLTKQERDSIFFGLEDVLNTTFKKEEQRDAQVHGSCEER